MTAFPYSHSLLVLVSQQATTTKWTEKIHDVLQAIVYFLNTFPQAALAQGAASKKTRLN
jgi:hypothetical protein